jgi:hypothetical protein
MSYPPFSTPLGRFEFGFSLFFNPSLADENDIINNNENVYCQQYKLYSDNQLTNLIGYGYWSGQVNNFNNTKSSVDCGTLVIDLDSIIGLGSLTTSYSFLNLDTVQSPYVIVSDLFNNSIITGGTKNFKYAMGSILISNNYNPSLCELIFYNKVK